MKPSKGILVTMGSICVFAFLCGCGSTPEEDRIISQHEALQKEMKAQSEGENDPTERANVSKAATDYMKEKQPDWSVDGVSMFSYAGNLFLVGVDAQSGTKRQTFNLVTRLFVSTDGRTYWKADACTPMLAETLSGNSFLRYRNNVEAAKSEEAAKEQEEREQHEHP